MPVAGSASSRVCRLVGEDLDADRGSSLARSAAGLPLLELGVGQRAGVAAVERVLDRLQRVLEALAGVAADEEDVVAHGDAALTRSIRSRT